MPWGNMRLGAMRRFPWDRRTGHEEANYAMLLHRRTSVSSVQLHTTYKPLRVYSDCANLLALPTLDMYLPLSKFESIHRVFIDATV